MKACIITVYNSENCGSFWQARALQCYFERLGYEVSFLKRNMQGSSHTKSFALKKIVKAFLEGNMKEIFMIIKQYKAFSKIIKVFSIVQECNSEFDLCILGSDTIWNIQSEYFIRERNTYWGKYSNAKKTISYAASIADTKKFEIERYPELIDYLNKLDAISVRDSHSKKVVKSFIDHDIKIVCDPTMLFDKTFYLNQVRCKHCTPFIFVYYFRIMPEKLQNKIVQFASEHGLEIIVMGNSMDYCDKRLHFSPNMFIECFANAQFVVTNTFHGTIFSLIFEKQAVFNSQGKSKIIDILERFDIAFQDVSSDGTLDEMFDMERIDYRKVNKLIKQFRESSIKYIRTAIEGVNK